MWRVATIACLVLGLAASARAEEEPKPPRTEITLPRTAPAHALRAAIDARVALDSVEVVIDPDSDDIIVRREDPPFEDGEWGTRRDPAASRIRHLDAVLAEEALLRAASDEELGRRFDAHFPPPPRREWFGEDRPHGSADALLIEIARRGGAAWTARLTAKLKEYDAWRTPTAAEVAAGDVSERDPSDFELLIALCRLEGSPAPVRMDIDGNFGPTAYPSLPAVRLRMVFRDPRPVTATRGGDYRSGREQRFHVEVRDASGRVQPAVEWFVGFGGGMYTREQKREGDALGTTLELGNYVEPLAPGTYEVRIHYHDRSHLGDADRHLGMVTVSSEPFDVEIEARVVVVTASVRKQVAKHVKGLDPDAEVQVLGGAYGEWAHEAIPPESPAGRILALGDAAVPPLIEAAADEGLDARRRAWVLGLLASITGHTGAALTPLGAHTFHGGGLRRVSGGGFAGLSSRTLTTATEVSPEVQLAAVDAWRELIRHWEIRSR